MEQLDLFGTPKFHIGDKPIRLIEMLAGVGSQLLSLKNLGVNVESHFVCEIDKYPMMGFNAIHGTNYQPTDICDVKGSDLKITDKDKYVYIMTWSFPCQDISLSGFQASLEEGSGTRSSLAFEVIRILEELGENRPQILLMENVKNLLSKAHKRHFLKLCDYLRKMGYSNHYQVMDSAQYGIPQHRERVFMVSIEGDYDYQFPKPVPLKYCLQDFLEDEVDEKYYLKEETVQHFFENNIVQEDEGNGFRFEPVERDGRKDSHNEVRS